MENLFSTVFWIVPIMIAVVFVLVIGVFVFVAVKGIGQWNKNNHSPRLTVSAAVVAKRIRVSGGHMHSADVHHHTHTTTSYYVTFQVDSGDRMELAVDGTEYGMLVEGDRGELTFQGTRYLGFARKEDTLPV